MMVNSIVEYNLCTGCGTCSSLCPKKAIKMTLNPKKGIFLPKMDENKCNQCGICYKVCPGEEVDFNNLNMEIFGKLPEDPLIGNYTECYTGYSTNDDIRFNSSSGGLITQFLIFALEEGIIDGALVTRMSKDNPLMPEPFIARTKEEVIGASRSKYCPVPANIALREILDAPDDEKFAVVGLPCHIHGIRKAETVNKRLKSKIKLHLGIICGTTKNFNGTIYQLKRMKIPIKNIKEIFYRGEGWPGKLKVKLKTGHDVNNDYLTYYDGEFCSFTSLRCCLCTDHMCELSDMSFGDAWIDEIKKKDNKGTSILIIRNKLSANLINIMQYSKFVTLDSIDAIKIAKSQRMCAFKKRRISSRFTINKLLRKKLPNYNQSFISNKFSDYLLNFWLYFWIKISSKQYLWRLFKLKRMLARIFS